MADVQLNAQHKTAFETFGYLSFPGLLADRASAMIDAFEAVWAERGGGHGGTKHEGKARSCIVPFIDQSVYLSSLLDDPRINGILSHLLGRDFNYMGSDGNYYVGDTPWHSDGWNGAVKFTKIAFYLDPLTRDTGALRVIPGSHQSGTGFADVLHNDIFHCQERWGLEPREIPAVAVETKPGDVLIFNHNIKHASFGGNTTRRMFTINACQRISQENLPILKDYISSFARFWVDSVYGSAMKAGPPSRQIHLEQALAHESHLPALAAKARQDMKEPARG